MLKKVLKPKAKRQTVQYIVQSFGLTQARSCQLVGLERSSYYYKHKDISKEEAKLQNRIKELADRHQSYGCPRIHVLLKREGWHINHKKTERIYYKCLKLTLKRKKYRKKRFYTHRVEMTQALRPNEKWCMDFVHDRLWPSGSFRMLTIVDPFTRECLRIEVDKSLNGNKVTQILQHLSHFRGQPKSLQMDNGPEFRGLALDQWAYENKVQLDFIRPGQPTDNAYIESFNGKLRLECLNRHYFLNLKHAKSIIEKWRTHYNFFRPHSSLDGKTPMEFSRSFYLNYNLNNVSI